MGEDIHPCRIIIEMRRTMVVDTVTIMIVVDTTLSMTDIWIMEIIVVVIIVLIDSVIPIRSI